MCDKFTAIDDKAALAVRDMSRRDFASLSAAAAIMVGCNASVKPAASAGRTLREGAVAVHTQDGEMDAFFMHPVEGRHPGIILWPDIAGLREVFKEMARRLASAGYAVLIANQYYRNAKAPVLPSLAAWRTPEGQEKLKPMIAGLTPDTSMRDAAALVSFLDAHPAVNTRRRIGATGYCMGGAFAVRSAAASQRVGASASFHGGNLVGQEPTSPVNLIATTSASFLFAVARNDDARTPTDKDALKEASLAAHRSAEITVYAADHGWCVSDAPSYDAVEAEKAWQRMLTLFAAL
jgi:carboxymethylenebutenolidase